MVTVDRVRIVPNDWVIDQQDKKALVGSSENETLMEGEQNNIKKVLLFLQEIS